MHHHIYKNMDQTTTEKHLTGTSNLFFIFLNFFAFCLSFVFVVHFLVCFFYDLFCNCILLVDLFIIFFSFSLF